MKKDLEANLGKKTAYIYKDIETEDTQEVRCAVLLSSSETGLSKHSQHSSFFE